MPDQIVKTEVAILKNGNPLTLKLGTVEDFNTPEDFEEFVRVWTFSRDGDEYRVATRSVIIHTTDWTVM